MDHGCQKRLWALTLGTVLGLLMSMELLEFGLNTLSSDEMVTSLRRQKVEGFGIFGYQIDK